MAGTVVDRTWRPSAPGRIDADLASLWRDLAREMPIARAILSNLIVFCERPAGAAMDVAAPIDVAIEEVARRHPSRVIVLTHESRESDTHIPLAAGIGVMRFGPPQARYGVEQIAVHSACADSSLPSIIRGLTLGDLPTSLWWTEDLSRVAPIDALVNLGRQMVYDSARWQDVPGGIRRLRPFLEPTSSLALADLNWRRLTAMRQALVHAVASDRALAQEPVGDVHVRHRPGEAALAWLLIGWLEARLCQASVLQARIEAVQDPETLLVVTFMGMTATLTASDVVVRVRNDTAPLVVAVPQEHEADAVAAELRSLASDRGLRDALNALMRRFEF